MKKKLISLALLGGLIVTAPIFAEGASFNGLNVGVTLGVNPNYFSANENIWVTNSASPTCTESGGGTCTVTGLYDYQPFAIANEDGFNSAELDANESYDGTNGLMGWNIGLVARYGFMDNLFARLGVNYSRVLAGNEIKNSLTDMSGLGAAEIAVSISGYTLGIPISFGIGQAVGKAKVYVGLGPSLFMANMTRKVEMSGAAFDTLLSMGAIGSKTGEVSYSTGLIMGVHWIVGAEYELSPGLSLGVDIMTSYGGKVVTEKVANTDAAATSSPGYISNTYTTGTSDTALSQTINLSGTRINIAVLYKLM